MPSANKLLPEDVEDIIALYKSGYSISDIARYKKVANNTIRHHLSSNNIPIHGIEYKTINPEKRENIIRTYQAGHSLNETARRNGVSPDAVRRCLQNAHITVRISPENQPLFNKLDTLAIIRLYRMGLSTVDIAKKFDCAQRTIYNVLKRNGVKFRSPSEAMKLVLQRKRKINNEL